jgi:hypothetical protein
MYGKRGFTEAVIADDAARHREHAPREEARHSVGHTTA